VKGRCVEDRPLGLTMESYGGREAGKEGKIRELEKEVGS
jgi:hypothetical protein